jgi:hypothetical protein
MDTKPITPRRFHEAAGVEDWRVLGEGACAYFRTGSFGPGPGWRRRSASWTASTPITRTSTSGTRA